MVRDGAQLYTMEGIAAGLIMLITAYLVLGSTSVYTPGDTHLTDMQLEQVGSDLLKVMDTPLKLNNSRVNYQSNRTYLERVVNSTDHDGVFYSDFTTEYLWSEKVVARETAVGSRNIQINATVWYRRYDGTLGSYILSASPGSVLGSFAGKAPGVRVTRWVHTYGRPFRNPTGLFPIPMGEWNRIRQEPQEVLVEVLLWKP